MIIYNRTKPVDCTDGDCVGTVGDNLAYTQEFYIKGISDETISYTLHIRFCDGSVNSVTPSTVYTDGKGTLIRWVITKNDIFVHGSFELQIEGRNSLGLVYQTEIVRLYANESLPVEDKEYENPNSETLKLRQEAYEALGKLQAQQTKLDENIAKINAASLDAKADKATTYTKTEVDAKFDIKADKSSVYTKSESDTMLAQKESLSNKITEMTDSDGDGDYPTSNAVKNYLEGNYYNVDEAENVFQAKLVAGENITIGSVQGKAVISADLSGKADKDEVYKKTDIDTKLNEKADKSTTYTKTEADAKLDDKENISNKTASINKSCTDEQYPTAKAVYQKLSKVYTKAEVNGLYGLELAVGYNSNDVPVKIAGNSTISAGKFASDEIVKIYVGFTQGIIQNGAFVACPNLTDIYFYNVKAAYSIANNAVPDGVTVHFAETFNNIECVTKTVCNFKTAKYDSSNIEEGNATLTAYTGQGDNIKSASCIYQRIGGFVTVNAAVVFNAVTLNANSSIHLINLPYRNAWDTPVRFTGISSKNAVFKGSVPKSSTWLSMMYATPKAYTFTDGEQLNFTLTYKI